MPTLITLIRHGETDWNVQGKWQGHAHVPLNALGRRQAEQLAEHLAAPGGEGSDVTCIYASDLLRAFETARIVGTRLGKTVVPEVRLREIDMGQWQGLTGDEVRTWDADRWAAVVADPARVPRPDGETSVQVAERALHALEDMAAKHRGEHVMAVTHGGTIVNVLRKLGLWQEHGGVVGNTSMSRLLHDPDLENPWSLDVFNVLVHLKSEQARTDQEP